MTGRRHRRWFLPETPDVLGLLADQAAITTEALGSFVSWAAGDAGAAQAVREAEPRGDAAKRVLLNALREAFVVPLEPEDLFTLSRGIDWILDYARDLIEESEAMACPPDAAIEEMGRMLLEAARKIGEAITALDADPDRHLYSRHTAELLAVEDMRERIARRELYRRCSRIGETAIDVAERIVYAEVKQS
jgi:uncharacterized protein Yka (UPF0111/DUF47 family)